MQLPWHALSSWEIEWQVPCHPGCICAQKPGCWYDGCQRCAERQRHARVACASHGVQVGTNCPTFRQSVPTCAGDLPPFRHTRSDVCGCAVGFRQRGMVCMTGSVRWGTASLPASATSSWGSRTRPQGNWHRFCPFYERMTPAPAPRQGSAMAGVINDDRQAKCWSTGHRATLQGVSSGEGRGEEGMSSIVIDYLPRVPVGQQPLGLVERKGLRHPDSLCDAIMAEVTQSWKAT